MNAPLWSRTKRHNALMVTGLALLLVTPLVMWAGKTEVADGAGDDSRVEIAFAHEEARRLAGASLPAATMPPPEFSPFGGVCVPRLLAGREAAEALSSPLGDVSWDPAQDPITAGLSPDLRWDATDLARTKKGAMRAGLNYVQLTEAAMADLDEALRALGEAGTILSALPRSTCLIYVEARNLHLLSQSPFVRRVRAMEAAMKIAADLGARPEIMRTRAGDPNLRVSVTLVPGTSFPDAVRTIASIPGVTDVVEGPFGSPLDLKVHYTAVGRLARVSEVLAIDAVRDMMLMNDENVPTIQAGSGEDANFLRPFDLVGVDGGGLNASGLPSGVRVNNGTAQVPPQIVTVVDNGISYDTPSFAQTATQTTTITSPIGPAHRKVHAIQSVVDNGTTCDAPLSGGSTHGHIVASTIAAYASQLGAFAYRSGIGGPAQPRGENLDGVARGARILLQDAAAPAACTINSLVERGGNVTPGPLATRLNLAICPISGGAGACAGLTGGGMETHLAVLPFGAPSNFSTLQFQGTDGTYPMEAVDVDTFLYNNRDFMVFSPVGNNGGLVGNNRPGLMQRVIPDLFNGTALDDPPPAKPIQIPPPATAKNVVSVGSSATDCFTFFGSADCEETMLGFTSRGPATPGSLRMAPIVTAPAFDLIQGPYTAGVAVFRSNDNDNLAPIDAQLDEGNFGSSYAAAYVTGAGAILRDYFAQGFYPTGDRRTAHRMPNLSGAFVKAALAASADFNEGGIGTQGQDAGERQLRRTRAMDMGIVAGVPIGIMGNSEQGYGRAVLTHVLPLSSWPDNFVLHPVSGAPREYPAAGMLAFDRYATLEPLITNAVGGTSVTHTFRVAGNNVTTQGSGAVVMTTSQLRIALAWPDIPSPAGGGGPLINDLDLIVESPGPDNCLADTDTRPDGAPCAAGSAADNQFYDGNHYDGGQGNAMLGQWSLVRTAEIHDFRNPIEAAHLVGDPNFDGDYADSRLYLGRWRVTVRRGWGPGGAPEDPLVILSAVNEDANGNGRLDAGEDANANGLLDQPGQPYALVVAGPVFAAEPAPAVLPGGYPASQLTWTAGRYSCSSNAILTLLDTTGAATAGSVKAAMTFQSLNAAGAVVDTESNFDFFAGTAPFQFVSAAIPVRLAGPAVAGNGILEADTDYTIAATYNPGVQPAVTARALVRCSPDLINAAFATAGGNAVGEQFAVANGCDNDDNFDAGEVVTYGVALQNRSRGDAYADLTATLTPSGPGAAALRVLDSPKNLGSMPGGAANGVFFHVFVDPAIANGLAVANRVVTLTLTLDSLARGERVGRQSYSFLHAINSDRDRLFYSTDYPNGGREVRDLNRNLVIDPPENVDRFLRFIVPREDVTFAALFSGSGAPPGHFTNELGEDLDGSATFNGAERDLIPNGTLDRGILNSNLPADPAHRVPWSFDRNNGGWMPFRHPGSTVAGIGVNPAWEYKAGGFCTFGTVPPGAPCFAAADCGAGGLCNFYPPVCGFQTQGGPNRFGIWHTGDGDPTTPAPAAMACDNHPQPFSPLTPPRVELILDVLESPILAKVNQNPDARGFAYNVEFQRLAFNENIQFADGYAGGGVDIDNNIDNDNGNSLLGQELDAYYARRAGGWAYGVFRDSAMYFDGPGIGPTTTDPFQRTFGPFVDGPVVGVVDSGDSGFAGPLLTAPPDRLPYQMPGSPPVGVCDGGTKDNSTCDPLNPADPCITGGGVCVSAGNNVAGPVRNFEATLIGYEGGWSSVLSPAPLENSFSFLPGRGGTRWQIGFSLWALESLTGLTDYGKAVDDVVFEWTEWHPQDEAALGNAPACSRFNGLGQPQGGQCATLTADRTTLYECDEGLEITLYDAKCIVLGAGNTVPLGGACNTHSQCGAGGTCTAARPSVQVRITTESDSTPVSYQDQQVFYPNAKTYTLNAVPGSPGLFRGTVIFSTTTNDASHVFNVPGSNSTFTIYYDDPLCDGDRDGQANEDDFANIDGDSVPDATDNCPQLYNPGQEDFDLDAVGDLCDNCPDRANPDQADTNVDGAGDRCEFDDADGTVQFAGDGVPDNTDNCPDVHNPEQTDSDAVPDGRGDLCDTQKSTFGNANGRIAHSFYFHGACVGGLCTKPLAAVGRACGTDEDCNAACDAVAGVCKVQGTCNGGANAGAACTSFLDCASSDCAFTWTSPPAKVGAACATNNDCWVDRDRDGDGVVDAADNCVLTPNPTQSNSDGDRRGDACDPDCTNRILLTRCSSNANSAAGSCVTGGAGYATDRTWTIGPGPAPGAVCSTIDDDYDVDFVEDSLDDCPGQANPPIIPGTLRQRDSDRDGLGDACDPAGTFDDENNGLPDDVVTFNGFIACRTQVLADLAILSAAYSDFTGDHDAFPDTGETGRVQLVVRNDGVALTDATIVMTTSDADVACVTRPSVLVGSIASGATVTIGNFEFTAADAPELDFVGIGDEPETIDLCLTVVANETMGVARPICFTLLADLDAVGPGAFTFGPDGLNMGGAGDDGIMAESFDTDRDGDGVFTVADTWLDAIAPGGVYRGFCSTAPTTPCVSNAGCPLTGTGDPGLCYRGTYLRGTDSGQPSRGAVAAVACGGFDDPLRNPLCVLDPDYPMDWHLHCPAGAANCPHTDTPACVGACSYDTPSGGDRAHSIPNSLHMGAHFDLSDSRAGDSTHFRTVQGFVSAPMNLTIAPRPPSAERPDGDLQMSFWQIVRLMDNNGVGPGNGNQCADCADVQIQLDGNPDPLVDDWGFWDKLVPYTNVYDHTPNAWSAFGSYYCAFTPTDTGNERPNPHGIQETLCYQLGAWSHCGSTIGTVPTSTVNCPGPGDVDPSGVGVWVQTKFNLAGYLGQRIRLRWIASTWNFGAGPDSYYELGAGWSDTPHDDGWWLDDIRVTGTVTQQVTPLPDLTPRAGTCPGDPCNQAIGDAGTNVVLVVTDTSGNITAVPFAGQSIRISAIQSTLPGGCVGGAAEYEFSRGGVVVQAFSSKSSFLDAPETVTSYSARLRCSTDFSCTSVLGASIGVGVYSGAGEDAFFGERASQPSAIRGVMYFRGTCAPAAGPCNTSADCAAGSGCTVTAAVGDDVTVLRWWGPGDFGTDLVRGTVPAGPAPKGTLQAPFWNLSGLAASCFVSNVAGVPVPGGPGSNYTSGTLTQLADPNPAPGVVTYYDVSSNTPGGANNNTFGCANPTVCSNPGWCELGTNAGAPCNVNADCAGGGTCLLRTTFCTTDVGAAELGGCGRHQACAGGTSVGRLCLSNVDCPGSTCPVLAANVAGGQVCYSVAGIPLTPPFGSCPAVGNAKRLVRRIGGAGLVCP